MDKLIKILHLEDLPSDAIFIQHALVKSKINYQGLIVDTKEKYIAALTEFSPDIILADHSLPSFNSIEALKILKHTGLEIPFIVITAAMSDESAVNLLMNGADDYILKDRLSRLPIAVVNALEKFRLKREHQNFLNELITSEKRYRALIEHSADGVVILDAHGKPTYVSTSVTNVLGYDPKEILEMNIASLMHPDDIPQLKSMMEKILANPGQTIKGHTGQMLHKDGSWRWIEATITNLLDDPAINGIVDNFRDITERKLAERAVDEYTNELVLSNKGLEQFSYMVSHNLRAPVANIIGLAGLLREGTHAPELNFEFLNGILDNVKRLDDVIVDLNMILHVKRQINENNEIVNFQDLVDNIKASIQSLIGEESVRIVTDFSAINEFTTLKTYLHSIFYNLIVNSIKYHRPGLAPLIEIKSYVSSGKLSLSFKDNGLGIDLNKRKHQLFGLYKRFHDHVEGKGMGLFMVKTQVNMLGGGISVVSQVNKGTEFLIEFNFSSLSPIL